MISVFSYIPKLFSMTNIRSENSEKKKKKLDLIQKRVG